MRRPLPWLLAVVPLLPAGIGHALELQPVVSGLSRPLYVTHARDGSGRLFIVEQAGIVKVLQPGASAPTVFLDITGRVLFDGAERGLLGLSFHPQYPANGRFFVHYTQQPDGAIAVAEFQRSAGDPNIASSVERRLLTIPHPAAANHNGGMLEFGPDGFLYVAVGDGGSANDPPNNAQNPGVLLGKIVRIDVNVMSPGLPYGIPPDNPFVGVSGVLPEIWALGLRNPFRFSFDRATGQLTVGDVGQNTFEEISVVTRGANLGWRVFEGFQCTGLDPVLCGNPSFTAPIAAYAHDSGRCSVTGGYVYRGLAGALAPGTYVFADFCSGEIFTLAGTGAAVLLDTPLAMSSFGEDEAGELYVVGLGGTVHRLAGAASIFAAVLPSSRSVQVNTPATAFATIVNAGGGTATGCRLTLGTPLPAGFAFQTTDPATNVVVGTLNAPVDIAPQSSQSFVFAITPTAPIPPTEVQIGFLCDGAVAPVFPGVNTLQFSAEAGPVADLVALTALPPAAAGILDLHPVTGGGVFGVASVNVGAPARVSATPDVGAAGAPFLQSITICPIDPFAQCLAPPEPSVEVDAPAGSTPAFAVFVSGFAVPFDPANRRVFVRFRDATGVVRGATSVAVRTR